MDDPQAAAIAYFAARGQVPCRWADDGEVLAWSDGTTIAYRQEIIFVLEWIVPHGWPPFGSLVWLLAACRGKLPPRVDYDVGLISVTGATGSAAVEGGSWQSDLFYDLRWRYPTVKDGLETISRLPEAVRTSLKAKATLAEVVFGGKDWFFLPPEYCQTILEVFRSGALTDEMLNHPELPPTNLGEQWKKLHTGLARLTPETLALRLRTGLDELPQPAVLPLPPALRVRAVVAELRADAEHAGLARLVRDFMAAIQLPRRLSEPDEMPIGGFADITNRGNPDRLLLSELAHDDLTLAVRIALNEALYLRREPPAKQPPGTLAVLLDSGVRLWGVPRVLAAAAALAFVAKSAAHEQCAVFRASGARLDPVDLLSKDGVIAHLGALEPHAHPGAALAALRAALAGLERAEAVLITHREVFADPDFQRDLALAQFASLYLALVDREGGFTLLRYPRGGAPLCEAQLDIGALFPAEKRAPQPRPLIDRAAHPDLPLILSTEPFPLLLSVRGKVQKAIRLRGGGGACVLQDRRLLAWRDDRQGARTVACELPHGSVLWLGELEDGALCVIKVTNGRRRLTCRVFSPEGGLRHSHEWQAPHAVQRAECHGGMVFLIDTRGARVRDLQTGAELATLAVNRVGSHGRYFCDREKGWCLLVWNGQTLALEPVVLRGALVAGDILRVFNHGEREGPWILQKNGDVHDEDGRCVLRLGALKKIARVSDDGRRLLVAEAASGEVRLIDLERLERLKKTWPHGQMKDRHWLSLPTLPTLPMRVRLRRIALLETGDICLQWSDTGAWWGIRILGTPCLLLQAARKDFEPTTEIQEFEPVLLPGQPGFSLKVARWPDGRCAWMDDRGMLHLRSARPHAPEITIVLSDSGTAVWSSGGFWSGNPFFIGDHAPLSAGMIGEHIAAFTTNP